MGHTGTVPLGSSNSPGAVDFDHAGLDMFARVSAAIAFLRDDAAAMSYQSMGQYRSALLRILGGGENAGVKCDMPTGPCSCGAWHRDNDKSAEVDDSKEASMQCKKLDCASPADLIRLLVDEAKLCKTSRGAAILLQLAACMDGRPVVDGLNTLHEVADHFADRYEENLHQNLGD